MTDKKTKYANRLKLLAIIFYSSLPHAATDLELPPIGKEQPDLEEIQYYDPISGKFLSAHELNVIPERELLFTVLIESIEIGEINTFEINEELYVDFQDVIEILEFPIELKTELSPYLSPDKSGAPLNELPDMEASGWFINRNNLFKLQTAQSADGKFYNITSGQLTDKLSIDDIQSKHNLLLLPLSEILKWFRIGLTVKNQDLILALKPEQKLPIQKRLQRQNRKARLAYKSLDLQYPTKHTPPQLFSPIFTDVRLGLRRDGFTNNTTFSSSILGTGDLAYMTANYYAGFSYNDNSKTQQTNARLNLTKYDRDSKLLGPLQASNISIGDISPAVIGAIPSSQPGIGIRINNLAYGQISNTTKTNITGFQQPGWDVELYKNGTYLDYVTTGDDGGYQFLDQELTIGENIFTLRFFGPQGEEEEETQKFNISAESLSGKKVTYDFSFINQNSRLSQLIENNNTNDDELPGFNLKLSTALTSNTSVSTAYSQFKLQDGTFQSFIQPELNFFAFDSAFNLNHVKNLDHGSLSGLSFSTRLFTQRFSYGVTLYDHDYIYNLSAINNTKISHGLGLSGPLASLRNFKLNYSLNLGQSQTFDDSTSQSMGLNISALAPYLRLNSKNTISSSRTNTGLTTTTQNGQFSLSSRIKRVTVRGGVNYTVQPVSRIDTGSLNAYWNITNNLKAQVGLSHSFNSQASNKNIGLSWRTNKFNTYFKVNQFGEYISASINIGFGLAHNPLKNEFYITRDRMAGTGAVAALVFEDANNNQMYDTNEILIENAEILAVQQRKMAKTDDSGTSFLTGLRPYQATDVILDKSSLEDPFWVQSTKGTSFIPRPGLINFIMIPIVTSGEIEGSTSYAKNLFAPGYEQGGVPLSLIDKNNVVALKTKSSFDGYFLFEGIKPGEYTLQINSSFLEKNQLETRSPIPITIDHKGSLIMGANFEFYPKGKYEYTEESITKDESYHIDLGSFLSEENAKTVLQALRSVFHETLSSIQGQSPYEMLLIKSSNTYNLVLGPLFDLNSVKYICGSLVKENLQCLIKKRKNIKQISQKPGQFIPKTRTTTKPITIKPIAKSSSNNVVKNTSIEHLDSNFTIQLMSTSRREGLEKFIEDHNLDNAKIFTVNKSGKISFILTLGNYTSRSNAEKESISVKNILHITPWIRSFGSIKPR